MARDPECAMLTRNTRLHLALLAVRPELEQHVGVALAERVGLGQVLDVVERHRQHLARRVELVQRGLAPAGGGGGRVGTERAAQGEGVEGSSSSSSSSPPSGVEGLGPLRAARGAVLVELEDGLEDGNLEGHDTLVAVVPDHDLRRQESVLLIFRTNRTRRVLHPVLIGHALSLTPSGFSLTYEDGTSQDDDALNNLVQDCEGETGDSARPCRGFRIVEA